MPRIRDSQVDLMIARDQNFHQRQIKNARPSVDPYDYVVRKELKDSESLLQEELKNLQDQIDNIDITSGGGGSSGGIGNVLFEKHTLTANTLISTAFSAITDGGFLLKALIIEATGILITWDASLFGSYPDNLNVWDLHRVIVVNFVSVNGKWWLANYPSS